jgi:hypothetical protein
MMGCIIAILALMLPRGLMFFIWLLTDWFARAFSTWWWPLLGFLFMPYTTLAVMAAMLKNNHSVSGFWLALVILAAFVDISHWGGGGRTMRRRRKRLVRISK